jgi:hypothetical protein
VSGGFDSRYLHPKRGKLEGGGSWKMVDMAEKPQRDMEERHALPADDPEEALLALLQVDPDSEPAREESEEPPDK